MGGPRKQFRAIDGVPLLFHTLRALRRCKDVDSLVVAMPEDHGVSGFSDDLGVHAVIVGGATRQDSVARAMKVLPPAADVILVHDAVRPFVEARQVSAVIAAARESGAAALAVPATDTMRYGCGGYFTTAVSRDGLYHMQTPQGFRRQILEGAIAAAESAATDEVALVQRLGHRVTVVPGSRNNVKITTGEDWEWATMHWPSSGT